MTDAHALLQAVWETGERTPLLALADLLDERGDHAAAALIRLTVADATTARHSGDRTRQLKQLRDDAWKRAKAAPWPDMAVRPDNSASGFSRRPDLSSPTRETIVVRPERRIVHWLRVELDGSEEVVRSRAGLELLRRELPPATIEFVRRGSDIWGASLGFAIEHDYFPLPDGWQAAPAPALADRQHRMETALAPALIPIAELPADLVPVVAWVLAEYLTNRVRRARGGEPVPGAHLFVFDPGAGGWRHAALGARDSGRAADFLRKRLRWERGRGIAAGLLVRVADDSRVTARKLVWFRPTGGERETPTLTAAAASLSGTAFGRVASELALNAGAAERFVADTPEKLLGLFAGAA
jgi:uncharacterized protein (TIGR02996 family)